MTDDRSEQQRLFDNHGLEVETVGDIISPGEGGGTPTPEPPFVVPCLGEYPLSFPGAGIYFDMPEEVYHGIPALSNGGMKLLASSPMLYWAKCPWMNPDFEPPEQKDHFDIGHAYHCRILEGREAFASRFAIGLDKKDYPNAVDTMKEIRAKYPEGIRPKGADKRTCFDYLATLDGTLQLWDDLVAEHAKANEGKCMIDARTNRQIEIAAAMIEKDPELADELKGGWPEVSLFWNCPVTGVPKKMRVDYLQFIGMVDFKSFQNTQERSIDRAIQLDIANRRYPMQPSHYFEGAAEVRKLVLQHGASVVHASDDAQEAWALKWAQHDEPDTWLWIFQQKGVAPVTRGVNFSRLGHLKAGFDGICLSMSKTFRRYSEVFGLDPWIDSRPIYELADDDLPPWSLEF